MRKPCRIVEELLQELGKIIVPGIKTREIDSFSSDFIQKKKAKSALKGYKGFPGNVCISVNNVAAHGIGNDYCIQEDDLVTVDTTVEYEGWHGDGAWTYTAGKGTSESRRLVKAAWKTMLAGANEATAGNRLGDIGYAITKCAKKYGCRVIEDLAGHGIGRDIHEEPVVLNFGKKGKGIPVVPGMVITIEPILVSGGNEIKTLDDNWSIVTKDNKQTAQFECTIAVFSDRTEILTLQAINLHKYIDFPPMF